MQGAALVRDRGILFCAVVFVRMARSAVPVIMGRGMRETGRWVDGLERNDPRELSDQKQAGQPGYKASERSAPSHASRPMGLCG
jgi:hypothetical protein